MELILRKGPLEYWEESPSERVKERTEGRGIEAMNIDHSFELCMKWGRKQDGS